MILLSFLWLAIKTFVELIIIYYLTRITIPITSKILGFKDTLTGHSRNDLVTFLTSWVIIAPIICSLFESFFLNFSFIRSIPNFITSFGYIKYYLLCITIWGYDIRFENFKIKPLKVVILRAVVFLILIFILELITFTYVRDGHVSPILFYMLNNIVKPSLIGILIIYYVRKNKEEKNNNA